MSGTRITDRLSDIDERVVAEAEAHLDRLLSLEPSPEFAAKVLARISAPHTARGWRAGWVGLALASAAGLVIVGTLTLRTGSGVADRAPSFAKPPQQDVVLGVEPSDMRDPTSRAITVPKGALAAQRHVGRSLKTAPLRVAEPEVLIDPLLGDAIRRLAVSTRNVLLDDTTPESSLQPASDVPVPSVVVEPLTVPELVLKPADQNGGR
jgi:hypothetical protein